jgi:hypothetical protein
MQLSCAQTIADMRLSIVSSFVWATNAAVTAAFVPSSLTSVADSAFNVHQRKQPPAASILQLAKGYSSHVQRSRRRQGKLKSLARERMRHLQQKPEGDDLVECIPFSSSSSSTNADVGILSCAIGQYCTESSLSTLGGYCHQQVHVVEEAVMQQQLIKNPKYGRRDLQDDNHFDGTPFLELAQDICSMAATAAQVAGDDSFGFICNTCQVSDFEYAGKFDCTYATDCYTLGSLCNATQVEFCENHTLEGTLSGEEDFEFKACYSLTKPKSFSYCVTYTYSPDPNQDTTCDMEIQGIRCNSCTLLFQGAVTADWCREFDCENTPLGTSASICDYNILEAFATAYLYDQLPCENGCNLCGEGARMTDSATKQFTIPRVATLNCFQTQLLAMTGNYNRQQCLELEELVNEPCNCEEASPTASPKSATGSSKQTLVSISGMAAAVATVVAWV